MFTSELRAACWLLTSAAAAVVAIATLGADAQYYVPAQEVSAMFPGLSELRRAQETKLRDLLASPPADTPRTRWESPVTRASTRWESPVTRASTRWETPVTRASTRWDSAVTRASTPRTRWENPATHVSTPRTRWETPSPPLRATGTPARTRTRLQQDDAPPPPPPPPRIDESREPITNRPASWTTTASREDEPDVTLGPDDADMSPERRRRARATADAMCEEYEAWRTRRVSAIPLVPSPAPVSVSVPRCSPAGVPLVVGGEPVSVLQHPHAAALGWRRARGAGYVWKCGGSLVSAQFVLTAAHCSYQDRDTAVLSGPPRVVQLGSARLDDEAAMLARVAHVVKHPRYRAPAAYYDIALLRLAAPVEFSERVLPACVGEPPPPGASVVATGWGRTEYGGDTSQQLRGVSLPVWELDECARVLGSSRKLPRGPDARAQICAGDLRGGKDTCQGDSGGPAAVSAGCGWRVVGVTSLGRACGAPHVPALYARALPEFVASVVWPDRV